MMFRSQQNNWFLNVISINNFQLNLNLACMFNLLLPGPLYNLHASFSDVHMKYQTEAT
jgi:hypothetical protein